VAARRVAGVITRVRHSVPHCARFFACIDSPTTFVQYRYSSTTDIVRSLKPLVQFGEQVSGWCAATCRTWRHPVAFAIQ